MFVWVFLSFVSFLAWLLCLQPIDDKSDEREREKGPSTIACLISFGYPFSLSFLTVGNNKKAFCV
ncbi:MAG: hypothetical protein J3R72DRAFT_448734 [Linnemannia gamsii]|nr:MAG: hypothetical protein J3R72DRAFT_448734 [Linnemannia gamsii]